MAKDGWIEPYEEVDDARIFRRERFGEWISDARRCAVQSRHDQCPNVARYGIMKSNGEGTPVCPACLGTWVARLADERGEVLVHPLHPRRRAVVRV